MLNNAPSEIPERFLEQTRDALKNLYDFPALQHSPLAQTIETGGEDKVARAHQLRRKLFEAIEALDPGQDAAADSSAARIYNLVYLHYVGGMTVQQSAVEAGVSLRQAYRDLQRGQEHISAILWHEQAQTVSADVPPETAHVTSIDTEINRIGDSARIVALQHMLERSIRAVQALADKHNVALGSEMPTSDILLTTNPTLAQQVLIHLLSQVIQRVTPEYLHVTLEEHEGDFRVVLSYPARSGAPEVQIEPLIEQMMRQIRWKTQSRAADGEHQLILMPMQKGALLAVIDDNEGLVDLLQRYFTGNAYRVIAVPNNEQGLGMMQRLIPDAIILDLMMPGMDGWEVLQRLRTHPDTRRVPVIICSVINDPELAYSLGASRFVAKPVTRETLLAAMGELGI